MLNIGCHLSIAYGFTYIAQTALTIGANTFQFFTRNPRGGRAKAINEQDVNSYLEIATQNNFKNIVAHAPYTLNLCSANPSIRKFSKETLIDDLSRTEIIPNSYYNLHPGSHTCQGADVGIIQIADAINDALKSDLKTTILLETMAGKGSEIGGTFEELKRIIDKITLSDKIGICLDTCHVFDAGYDIVSNLDSVLENFDNIIGINRLKAVHLNDSKNPCGSKKDRHEKIGKGHIGLDIFKNIVNHPELKTLPFILETPQDSLEGYAEEIKLLKNLII